MISWFRTLLNRSRWKEFVLLLGSATFCLCLWGFIELAEDAPGGEYLRSEERIMKALRQPNDLSVPIGPAWTLEASRDLTALGGPTVLVLLAALVLVFLILRGMHGTALLVAAAAVGGLVLSSCLKVFFHRARPEIVPHLAPIAAASFPSGHSMLSSIVYMTLGAILARTVAPRREKVYFIVASLFVTFLIGFSRVYLGVHYPTDVLAGWSAGTAWALLCWCVAHVLQRRGTLKRTSPSAESSIEDDDAGG